MKPGDRRTSIGCFAAIGGVALAVLAALFALYVAVARDIPGGEGPQDGWLAAFISTHRLEVPAGCVPPSYPVGSEGHRRQTGEESQTTLFLCLRASRRGCDRFSLFRSCWELIWPAEIEAVPGLVDFLVEAHRDPCRVVVPKVAGRRFMQWRGTGYFPQDIAEDQAPLLQDRRDGCSNSHTYVMKVRPLPPTSR